MEFDLLPTPRIEALALPIVKRIGNAKPTLIQETNPLCLFQYRRNDTPDISEHPTCVDLIQIHTGVPVKEQQNEQNTYIPRASIVAAFC